MRVLEESIRAEVPRFAESPKLLFSCNFRALESKRSVIL